MCRRSVISRKERKRRSQRAAGRSHARTCRLARLVWTRSTCTALIPDEAKMFWVVKAPSRLHGSGSSARRQKNLHVPRDCVYNTVDAVRPRLKGDRALLEGPHSRRRELWLVPSTGNGAPPRRHLAAESGSDARSSCRSEWHVGSISRLARFAPPSCQGT